MNLQVRIMICGRKKIGFGFWVIQNFTIFSKTETLEGCGFTAFVLCCKKSVSFYKSVLLICMGMAFLV